MSLKPAYSALLKASCPTATQDVKVNLAHRKKAIETASYGPLNPSEPNTEFWDGIAKEWDVTTAEAKKQRCGNCAAFIQTSAMLECINGGLAQGDTKKNAWDVASAGELGYCEAFDFKCASKRVCRAWIVGGPITDKNAKKVEKREFSTDERKKLAEQGLALSDGSYPIKTIQDLKNAIQSYGRATNKDEVKAHIIKRAKALNATMVLPENW
jgi:hypothetical protein